MGKKVKKAFKGVKKVIKKTSPTAAALSKDGKDPKQPDLPDPIPPAQVVEAPKDDAEVDAGSDTESDKRKSQSRGKNKLTVARSGGRGLNM